MLGKVNIYAAVAACKRPKMEFVRTVGICLY